MPKWRGEAEEPRQKGRRTKTNKWCKGKEGREHVPVIAVSSMYGYRAQRGDGVACGPSFWYGSSPDMRISHGGPGWKGSYEQKTPYILKTEYWRCLHEMHCANCGKVLVTNTREQNFPCPDKE